MELDFELTDEMFLGLLGEKKYGEKSDMPVRFLFDLRVRKFGKKVELSQRDTREYQGDEHKEASGYDYEDGYEDGSSGYILPGSDSKKLTQYDLQGLSRAELRIARNEIYARHGRMFQDQDLQEYFDGQDWYDGYIEPEDFVDSKMLSKLERRNAKFIRKFE